LLLVITLPAIFDIDIVLFPFYESDFFVILYYLSFILPIVALFKTISVARANISDSMAISSYPSISYTLISVKFGISFLYYLGWFYDYISGMLSGPKWGFLIFLLAFIYLIFYGLAHHLLKLSTKDYTKFRLLLKINIIIDLIFIIINSSADYSKGL